MSDPLIERLTDGLAPVAPRRVGGEIALLAGLVMAEAAMLVGAGVARPGWAVLGGTVAQWKIAAPALLAAVAALLAVRSASPDRAPARLWPLGLVAVLLTIAELWLWGTSADATGARDWHRGLACVAVATATAVPPALLFGWLLRRAAPADPVRTSVAAAVAAGALGTALLGLHCPWDDAAHTLVWHPLGIAIPALAAFLPLARGARW